MSQQHAGAANNRAATQSPSPSSDLRERVGIAIAATDATALLGYIAEAEAQGVRQLWMTQSPTSFDALSIYAAAFARTQHIRAIHLHSRSRRRQWRQWGRGGCASVLVRVTAA